MLFASMVSQATTSLVRQIHLQILNARFREINDGAEPPLVQAIVDGQEQRALFAGRPPESTQPRGNSATESFDPPGH